MFLKFFKNSEILYNATEPGDNESGGMVSQIIIAVNGVLLTAIIFSFLVVFTKDIIDDEHAYVSDHTVQNFVHISNALNRTIYNAADMIELSQRNALQNNIRQSMISNSLIDAMWSAEKINAQPWAYRWIYPQGQGTALFKVFQDKDRVVREALEYKSQNNIRDDEIFLFSSSLRDRNTTNRLLFLVLNKKISADRSIMLFGLIEMEKLFEFSFKNSAKYLTYMSLKTEELEWNYQLVPDQSYEDNYKRSFLLEMWNNNFEVNLYFNEKHKLYFLHQIPLFFAVVGVLLTLFVVVYVRNNNKQARRMSVMNKKLENKNSELRNEISNRERLNEALQQSEKENLSIIDAVSDIIFETDIDGSILFLSAAWRKVTGSDAEQFIGTEIFGLLHPQDQQAQIQDFNLLIKGQKQSYRSFTRLRTADGTFRAVEIAVSMIRQDQNKNLRVVGTFTDVEERRRAEKALSEAEKKYRTIVENAAGGIYQLTLEGIYLSANPAMARVLGYDSPEQILREVKNAYKTIYVDEQERENIIKELSEGADFYNDETQVYRKNGDIIWVSENIRAVKDDNNNILYFEGSIEDITKRKESEIALLEAKMHSDLANRAKSEFLANMSHELRTPLNSIIGFSEIIKNEVFGPIEQKSYWEYAKHINESGQNLLKVINEILDIARIEAGNRQLNEAKVNLSELMNECLTMMGTKIENNKMNIINSLNGIPNVKGEELAIKQIFMNLLSNSIKFTPSGGRITLSYEVDTHGELRISVTDTGIGIEEDQIEKALSPFGQINSNLDRNESGTGLGLTLVNALIKMHGGQFELLSQQGIGTTATIIFPVDRVSTQRDDRKENEEGNA